MKYAIALPIMVCCSFAHAQLVVDKPILLSGGAGERHVAGLPDGTAPDHALNASALLAGNYLYCQASGANALTANTNPTFAAAVAGQNLLVVITAANSGAVTIAVNGTAAVDVVKNGGQPLEAGDLQPGMVASLVFDGSAYQLTNARRLARRDCPSGFTQVTDLYCIEPTAHDTLYLDSASVVCGMMNARMCTWGEWYFACTQQGTLGLQNMGNQWEWTNSTANGVAAARVVGATSCTHAGVGPAYNTLARKFRCCYDR